jgi:hypothetical protein
LADNTTLTQAFTDDSDLTQPIPMSLFMVTLPPTLHSANPTLNVSKVTAVLNSSQTRHVDTPIERTPAPFLNKLCHETAVVIMTSQNCQESSWSWNFSAKRIKAQFPTKFPVISLNAYKLVLWCPMSYDRLKFGQFSPNFQSRPTRRLDSHLVLFIDL